MFLELVAVLVKVDKFDMILTGNSQLQWLKATSVRRKIDHMVLTILHLTCTIWGCIIVILMDS